MRSLLFPSKLPFFIVSWDYRVYICTYISNITFVTKINCFLKLCWFNLPPSSLLTLSPLPVFYISSISEVTFWPFIYLLQILVLSPYLCTSIYSLLRRRSQCSTTERPYFGTLFVVPFCVTKTKKKKKFVSFDISTLFG